MYDQPQFIPQGWQCPVCHRVYSPSTFTCYYCGDRETTVATNTEYETKKAEFVRKMMVGYTEKERNMSQNDKVLHHLEKRGSITAREAYECYGIMRLGARIDDLRHSGHRICTQMEQGENRYGELTRYARYRLEI